MNRTPHCPSSPRSLPTISTIALLVAAAITLFVPAVALAQDGAAPGTHVVELRFDDPSATPTPVQMMPLSGDGYVCEARGAVLTTRMPQTLTGAPITATAVGSQSLTMEPVALEVRDGAGIVRESRAPGAGAATVADDTVRYSDAWPGVTDVFTFEAACIKHDVVLEEHPHLPASAAFFGATWRIRLASGYTIDGIDTDEAIRHAQLVIIDSERHEHYRLGRVVVFDATGAGIPGHYRLRRDADGWLVTMEVSADDLRAAAYPVRIDPELLVTFSDTTRPTPFSADESDPQCTTQLLYNNNNFSGQKGWMSEIRFQFAEQVIATYPRIRLLVGETTRGPDEQSATFADNFDVGDPVVVLDAEVNASVQVDGFLKLPFETPFWFTGDNHLLVEIQVIGANSAGQAAPVKGGSFIFNSAVEAANELAPAEGTWVRWSINTIFVINEPPAISTPSPKLPNAGNGEPYSFTMSAIRGIQPYRWSISAGSLPTGLSINADTGEISGVPTEDGEFTFTVMVTDTNDLTGTRSYSILVGTAPVITTPSGALPDGTANAPSAWPLTPVTFSATSDLMPITWSATGLPPGLSIDPSTSAITGVPTAAGEYTVTVTARDAEGYPASAEYTITIHPSVQVDTTPLPNGEELATYSATASPVGGTGPYTWSLTTTPDRSRLSIHPTTGEITGAFETGDEGSWTVHLTVTDAYGSTHTADVALTVTAPTPSLGGGGGGGGCAVAADRPRAAWWLLALLILLVARRRTGN